MFVLFCYNLMHVRCFGLVVSIAPPSVWPHLFGSVVLFMRKGGESSRNGSCHLGCTSEVFQVHNYQDQYTQPGWAERVFVYLA